MGQILGQEQKSGSCITHKAGIQGQVGQESNLQPAVLETAALPIELPTYGTRKMRPCPGSIPHDCYTVKLSWRRPV